MANIGDFFPIEPQMAQLDAQVMDAIAPHLCRVYEIRDHNQLAMLRAFTACGVAAHHLTGSTGYGYDDAGREKLEEVFALLTGSEAALFRHQFMSGTHALAVALFGVLRPGDTLLCASGTPYDTLHGVLGLSANGKTDGSLADWGVAYQEIPLADGRPNLAAIAREAPAARILYLQRSRGYASRRALSLDDIQAASDAAKAANPAIHVVVDNCYGEFVATREPTVVGADLIVGSLIKNPGGGIAPTGGYIAGRQALVQQCAARLTAPGVGAEVGSTGEVARQLWLGLYYAPGVVAEALKTAIYASALFAKLGYPTTPAPEEERGDLITAITLDDPQRLVALCSAVQAMSPVDSFAAPQPAPMPGYDSDVIMAAGAFTQGSSIELSCDAPMRPPYTAYLQGGLNFTASRAAMLFAAGAVGRAE